MIIQGFSEWDERSKSFCVGLPMLGIWTVGEEFEEAISNIHELMAIKFPYLEYSIVPENYDRIEFYMNTSDKKAKGYIIRSIREKLGYSRLYAEKLTDKPIRLFEGRIPPTIRDFYEILSKYGVEYPRQESKKIL